MNLSSIEVSEESISEMDGKWKSVSILRKDIVDISLKYGFTTERPVTQAAVNIVLIMLGLSLGVYPLYGVLLHHDFPSEGAYPLDIFAYAVPLIIIGVYLFYRMCAKRFYLLVRTEKDNRKLVFKDKVSQGEVKAFVMNCKSLGYGVRIEETR
jgi:hypothetical protein